MPLVGKLDLNPCLARGNTRQATGRGQDVSGSEGNPHGDIRCTVRDMGGTSKDVDPGGTTGEVPCTMMVGYSVKYNASGIPRGPSTIGYDLCYFSNICFANSV